MLLFIVIYIFQKYTGHLWASPDGIYSCYQHRNYEADRDWHPGDTLMPLFPSLPLTSPLFWLHSLWVDLLYSYFIQIESCKVHFVVSCFSHSTLYLWHSSLLLCTVIKHLFSFYTTAFHCVNILWLVYPSYHWWTLDSGVELLQIVLWRTFLHIFWWK